MARRDKPEPPQLRDHDTLLVVGGAPCVWDDIEDFWGLDAPHDVCAVNEVGLLYPCEPKHAFSYHAQHLVEYGYHDGVLLHSVNNKRPAGVRFTWKLRKTNGSSSLMAVRCALQYWGYKRVVVAGAPISNDGHVRGIETSVDAHRYKEAFLSAWEKAHADLKDVLRSMSGNTEAIYGRPTKEWLCRQ